MTRAPDNNPFVPTDDFAARLEIELESLSRRGQLFNLETRRSRVRLRAVALICIVALCGVALGATSTLMMTSQARGDYQLAMKRAETALALAREQAAITVDQLQAERELVARGAASQRSLDQLQLEAMHANEGRRLRESELREIQYRRASPIDALSADRPGGRDFVAERLAIRLEASDERRAIRARQFEEVRALSEDNAMSRSDASASRLVLEREDGQAQALRAFIDLRASFLAGELSKRRVDLEALRVEYSVKCEELTANEERAAEQLRALVALAEAGAVSGATLREAEYAHRRTSLELTGMRALRDTVEDMITSLEQEEGTDE